MRHSIIIWRTACSIRQWIVKVVVRQIRSRALEVTPCNSTAAHPAHRPLAVHLDAADMSMRTPGSSDFATLYVALRADGSSYDDERVWPAPRDGRPGAWHGQTPASSTGDALELRWLEALPDALGAAIFTVEVEDIVAVSPDGLLARRARLLRRVVSWDACAARRYAADCAELVCAELDWPLPEDDLPRSAIQAVRDVAAGLRTLSSLHADWADLHALSRALTCDIPCVESWEAAWTALDGLAMPDAGEAARTAARAASAAAIASTAWWAGWRASMDGAWTAQPPGVIEARREAAADRARRDARAGVRRWQAQRLRTYLELPPADPITTHPGGFDVSRCDQGKSPPMRAP